MKRITQNRLLLVLCFFSFANIQAQELQTSSQYFSPSQQSGSYNTGNWSFGLGTGASFGLKNNEANLFRGNSMATKMFGRYYFGNIGLSAATGVLAGSISENSLNQFMTERGFERDQVKLTKGNPLNGFLLVGPSFRFGKKLFVNADIQGGLFLNNPGTVDVAMKADNRSMYRFDNGGKNYFPGFSGSISINYPLSRSTQFFISADYLQSRSSVNLLDLKGGYDVATQVNRDVKMMVAGIGIVKTFGRSGDRKHIGNVRYGNVNMLSVNGGNCGPVSVARANPDGSLDQMTFACPEDAAIYTQQRLSNSLAESYNPWEMDDATDGTVMNPPFKKINSSRGINALNNQMPSRLSMTPTTARKTQGNTFGEKVASGLQSGANAGIISGTIYWQQGNQSGIVTNEMASASGIGGSKPGGMTSSSYAAGKVKNVEGSSDQEFVSTVLAVRQTGKVASQRDFTPSDIKIINSSCNDCGVTITGTKQTPNISEQPSQMRTNPLYGNNGSSGTNPMYEASSIKGDNPLYEGNSSSGSNPLYQGKGIGKYGGLCGTTGHFLVGLYDAGSGMQVARTTADSCGNFWFANVPEGDYVVYVKGYALASKTYELSINKDGKYDVGGIMQAGNAQLMISLQSQASDNNPQDSKVVVRGWDTRDKQVIAGSQRVAGNPIPGLIVKGGKNPGADRRTVMTNGNGQFEFTGWKKGNYIITTEIPFLIDQKAIVSVGKDVKQWGDPHENLNGKHVKGWDGSVKGNSISEERNSSLERKGWDGSVKGNSITEAQNYNSTGSNKLYFTIANDGSITGSVKAQDHNSSRSNTTASIIVIGNDGTLSGRLNAQDFNTCRSNRERGQFARNSNANNSKSPDRIFFTVEEDGNVTGKLNGQDHNSSRSNTYSYITINEDGTFTGMMTAQDFNTCRSNRERGQLNTNPDDGGISEKGINEAGIKITEDQNEANRVKGTGKGIVVSPGGHARSLNDGASKIWFTIGTDGIVTGSVKAQDHNSSRSNTTASIIVIGNDGTLSGRLSAQDFNSCRSNRERGQFARNSNANNSKSPDRIFFTVGEDGNVTGKLNGQDHNSSRSNTYSYITINEDGTFTGMMTAQDFNTCRSNRERGQLNTNPDGDNSESDTLSVGTSNKTGIGGMAKPGGMTSSSYAAGRTVGANDIHHNNLSMKSIMVKADVDGDGIYETDVTDQIADELVLNENGKATGISAQNVRNRSALTRIDDDLYISYGRATVNGKETAVKSVLKTRHETAKNSINNVR